MKKVILYTCAAILLAACAKKPEGHRVVMCIPVYGQSLALGEEAKLITDFEELGKSYDGRIVTENMDHTFGYFDNDALKQWGKKLIGYKKRTFELSVYGMAEALASQLGRDTLICIFPGGQGATPLARLSKGTSPYNTFIKNIKIAAENARDNGWEFHLPAICWMQGESDIENYPDTDYKKLLTQFAEDINQDVKAITGQQEDVRIICYQSNNVTGGKRYVQNSYDCFECGVPQSQMELIRDNTLFWASGPTYPYTFVRERIHINGICQKRIGHLAALAAIDIIRGQQTRQRGLIPLTVDGHDNQVIIHYNVPVSPLQFDTTSVAKARNYGFSVITPDNEDILKSVSIAGDSVILTCSKPVDSCRLRYGINGQRMKSGHRHGPRGNLRDSQGDNKKVTVKGKEYPLHNWSYQFDMNITSDKQHEK